MWLPPPDNGNLLVYGGATARRHLSPPSLPYALIWSDENYGGVPPILYGKFQGHRN